MSNGLKETLSDRDEDVAIRVWEFLQRQHFRTLHDLAINVNEGTLTLEGTVGSFYEKQIALTVCKRTPGVQHFVDKIRVA